jgi:hypothetical protein
MRLGAPLFPPQLRLFIQQEGWAFSRSAQRVARGVRVLVRDSEWRAPYDVLLIGDSIFFGSLSGMQETIPWFLEKNTGWRVYNLSGGCRETQHYNTLLREYLRRSPHPAPVVVMVFLLMISWFPERVATGRSRGWSLMKRVT